LITIQTVTETLIRLAKQAIHPDTVLVFPDDLFEVQRTPSVILQGPKLTEDRFRRSQSRLFEKNVAELSFEECRFPRLYHLDFDLVVTVDREAELLGFHESVSRFLQLHPEIAIVDQGSLNLTELVPLGGLARVNLSNLRQSSGRIRIESCPVYDGDRRPARRSADPGPDLPVSRRRDRATNHSTVKENNRDRDQKPAVPTPDVQSLRPGNPSPRTARTQEHRPQGPLRRDQDRRKTRPGAHHRPDRRRGTGAGKAHGDRGRRKR